MAIHFEGSLRRLGELMLALQKDNPLDKCIQSENDVGKNYC